MVIAGAFRSILFPETMAVEQLPATSQTRRLLVLALASSTSAETDVKRVNEVSAAGFARPLPPTLSLAVQASPTFAACHAPSGDAHVMVGAIVSSGGLLPLMPASIHA